MISRKFLGIIVSKLLFFSVSAISCYRCENSSSLDECQENQDDVDCPIPVHYCARIRYESRTREGKIQTTYRKGCVTKDQCNANATSGKIVDCCKGDKCNTSKKKLFFVLRSSIKRRHRKLHFDFFILTHKNFKLNLVLALVLKSKDL